MAITYTHTFELKVGDLEYAGEIEFATGTYSESQAEELAAKSETDFKLIIESLKNIVTTYGSLEKFEVVLKE